MAGNLFAKERAIVTLTSTGASTANSVANAAGTTLDGRAAGNGADDFFFNFELTCQFATITNIIAGTRIADLFLVPAMDATNYASTDEGTASVLNIPAENYVGGFTSHKQLVATTDYRFYSGPILIQPLLYKAFIGNRSGQTISANWTLKAIGVQGQYT